MSGPTRGSVAGQAITTQAQTKEFDEHYERIFGKNRPVRGRFVFDEETQQMVEVGADWSDTERRAPVATEELVYGQVRPHSDGTPLDSKRKHREFMKQRGVTLMSDYSDEYRAKEKASKARENDRHLSQSVAEAIRRQRKP